ncbi:Glucose/ribitol dehydrogenase [Penicillium hispanicum]|uniref:Glucose/ribitol dehydrogenase n=1 Tax=Penicillium hispanicum TaxID=1080232 RepID=UPI002540E59C|nr:Glucose/ribitol dehydrogenase [Penicillium hispanicum]KAJ5595439.1 Glucose/ribitol dehydrogenase [Penicillium hispanicum]
MEEILEYVRPLNALEMGAFVQDRHDTYPHITPTGSELSGKSVFITGASRGIGRETAVRFAKAGCSKIALAARSSLADVVKEIETTAQESQLDPPQVLALQVDVTSEESVREAAQAVETSFGGKLDILINNAGYLPEYKPVGESDPTEWWKAWEVNVKGTFLCCHFLLPLVLRSDTKILINLSSIGAITLAYGGSGYQASRFANCRLTEFLVRDYEDQGLVAVSLHPGGIATDMQDNFPELLRPTLTDKVALPADTMVWLAKERREWLNGRLVYSSWDMKELEEKKDEIVSRDLFKFRVTL